MDRERKRKRGKRESAYSMTLIYTPPVGSALPGWQGAERFLGEIFRSRASGAPNDNGVAAAVSLLQKK